MDFFKIVSKRVFEPTRIIRLPRVVQSVETVVDKNGLLSSLVVDKSVDEFPDSKMNFRDFSIQTILRAGSIDLLKPSGSLAISDLSAADLANKTSVTLSSLSDYAESYKKANEVVE